MIVVEDDLQPIEVGIDFILSHVSGPAFPRNISTAATNGAQFSVTSRREIIEAAARADYIDLRINAYPDFVEYKGIQRQAPDFLFIDLDRSTFKTDDDHYKALTQTLLEIGKRLHEDACPSVIWSGNGYHVYLPLNNEVVLENVSDYAKFEKPSIKFLRFAEQKLSCGKCDPSHNPSFRSCMLRVPGSFNSKCILGGKDPEVKVIQRWNYYRPLLPLQLMKEFHNHLITEKINELQRIKASQQKYGNNEGSPGQIAWVEALLQTPIDDYRKSALALIVAPYLMNIKKVSYVDATAAIKAWLDLCDRARRLDSNFNGRIKAALAAAIKDKTKPMRLSTLQTRNPALFDRLKSSK